MGSMKMIALTLSAAVAVLGGIGVVAPSALLSVAEFFLTRPGLWLAAALRIVLGIALILVAPNSRFPRVLRVIGVLTVVAGIATPLIGLERARAIVEWETARGPTAMRIPAMFALALGSFLAYATARRGTFR
jgi:asparagine N-glycosylation enzyme membrane subunit Stt3